MTTTSQAKRNASRENGSRSRGPRTAAGKSRSARNSTRHGLLAARLLLPNEGRRELNKLRGAILASLAPEGGLEELLAERVVAAAWRLRRFERIETLMLENARKDWQGREVPLSSGLVGLFVNGDAPSKLSRYEAGIERALYRALHELQRLQAARAGVAVPLPLPVDIEVTHTTAGPDSGSFGSGDAGTPAPTPVLTPD